MSSKIADIRQSYVDGRFVTGDGEPLAVENPFTEEVIAEVETLSLAQMEEAVLAARRAFDSGGWSGLRREERIDAVLALGEYLAGRSEELGATLTAEAGSTVSMLGAQVGMPLAHLRAACDIYRTMPDVEHTPRPLAEVIQGNRVTASMMRYEPIGVVDRDRRLQLPAADAALEVRPCAADGQHRHRAAEPAHADRHARDRRGGGSGRAAGRVCSTSSSRAASRAVSCCRRTRPSTASASPAPPRWASSIMAQAAPTVKRVLLELGGKSVQLYLDDAIERAPMGCASVFAAHSGQACVAPTRMLVPEDRKAEVLEKAAGVAAHVQGRRPEPTRRRWSGH